MIIRLLYMIRVFGFIFVVSLMAIGCNNYAMYELEAVLADMSPGFETVALSHDQRILRQARALNTNQRELNDDTDAVWFVDRPLRLSPHPIP